MRTSGSSLARSARSRPSSASRAGNRAGGRPRPKVTAGVVEEGVTDPGGVRARAIAHVDMDAFYAAIEQRDRSELRGRPVIVGADPRGRGVVSAASYEARAFGVRSAMRISPGARRCPSAAFLPVDMAKYRRVSHGVLADLAGSTPPV